MLPIMSLTWHLILSRTVHFFRGFRDQLNFGRREGWREVRMVCRGQGIKQTGCLNHKATERRAGHACNVSCNVANPSQAVFLSESRCDVTQSRLDVQIHQYSYCCLRENSKWPFLQCGVRPCAAHRHSPRSALRRRRAAQRGPRHKPLPVRIGAV